MNKSSSKSKKLYQQTYVPTTTVSITPRSYNIPGTQNGKNSTWTIGDHVCSEEPAAHNNITPDHTNIPLPPVSRHI